MTVIRQDIGSALGRFAEAAASDRIECGGLYGVSEGWRMPAALWRAPAGFNGWTEPMDLLTLAFMRHGEPGARVWRGDGPHAGRGATARDRTITVQPAGAREHYSGDGPVSFGHAYLKADDLRSLSREAFGREVELRDDIVLTPNPALERALNDYLDRAMDAVEAPSAIEMDARAVLITLNLLRDHGGSAPPPVQHGGLAPWQLRRVRDHVEEYLARDIPLAELSALVRLSSYHFCRAFARSTGLPPHRWIQTRRIEHAKALLARPEGTILEVAAQVGYDNPGHFAKVFRKLVGMTPREFRRTL